MLMESSVRFLLLTRNFQIAMTGIANEMLALGAPKYKLKIPGLSVVEMLPKEPYHVAIYVAGSKKVSTVH